MLFSNLQKPDMTGNVTKIKHLEGLHNHCEALPRPAVASGWAWYNPPEAAQHQAAPQRLRGRTGVVCDVDGLGVVALVPQAVAGRHHEQVVAVQGRARDFRVRYQALALQVVIPQAPAVRQCDASPSSARPVPL